MSEQDLVSGCQKADNACRRDLYEKYAKKMMGICYRYTGSMHISEDLLHDGFIRIFESIQSFQYKGNGSLNAWMSKIFTNLALDYLRKNESKYPVPIEEWNEPADVKEEDFELIPQNVLMRFIAELPVGYRMVFNLNTFDDLSHKEIAEHLGINESSSRSQLTRAKAILSKKVKEYISKNA